MLRAVANILVFAATVPAAEIFVAPDGSDHHCA